MLLIITPAYLESEKTLERNIVSVQQQSLKQKYCQYIIFDGVNVNKFLKEKYSGIKNLFFFRVKRNHDDYGDYIRKLGTKIALRKGFNAITFLDADNYLDKNHLKQISTVHKSKKRNIIISKRRFIDTTGKEINASSNNFYDTNTMTFFNEHIKIGLLWAKYPKELSLIGDRIISHYINQRYFKEIGFVNKITLNYEMSKITKLKQDEFKKWYLNHFSNYKDKFIKTFGYDLKL